MKTSKQTSFKARDKVLKALANSGLHKLTADEILMAFKEEGVQSLEGLVKRLIEDLKESHLASQSPVRINLKLLAKQTPADKVARIVHKVPKVSFVLDGVQYDPKDIVRFNGRELHFIVGSKAAPHDAVLAFDERDILVNWLQMIYIQRFAGLHDTSEASSGIRGGVLQPGPYFGPGRGGGGAAGPFPGGTAEITMYEGANFAGRSLTMARGSSLLDLTKIIRYNFVFWGLSWNDAVSSIGLSQSMGVFFENTNLTGSIRIVLPGNLIFDLGALGFDECISSAANWG